jgi:Arc/MetJ-type ribon-helix-helix transcriptional regulator
MPEQDQIMERTSISLPAKQLGKIDKLVEDGEYPNRSEAIRDAVRRFTERVPA